MLNDIRKRQACLVIYAFLFPVMAVAQATFPTTTLRVALTGWPAAQQPATTIYLTSNAALVPGQNPIQNTGIGDPSGHTNQILMVDTEAMCVNGPVTPTGGVPVERGCQGTQVFGHSAGTTVWVGYPSYYASTIPRGPCNAPSLQVLPTIYIENAVVYDCVLGRWAATGSASTVKAPAGAAVWHAVDRPKLPWYKRLLKWFAR